MTAPTVALAVPLADPLAVTGQVFIADGHLDQNKKPDLPSLTNVSPGSHAALELTRMVEPAGAKGGFLALVASAVSDAAGRYSLAVKPDAALLDAARQNDGWVNFLLSTTTNGINQINAVSRHWNGSAWDSAGRAEFAPTTSLGTYVVRDAVTGRPLQGASVNDGAAGDDVTPPNTAGCTFDRTGITTQGTRVLEFSNALPLNGNWTYGQTADSDIGVGIKPASGDWSVSNTFHVGNANTATIGGSSNSNFTRDVITDFQYETIHFTGPNFRLCALLNSDLVYAKSWAGGATYDFWQNSTFTANYRTLYAQGTFFRRDNSRSVTYKNGVSLPFVSLESTSGYSTFVSQQWTAARGDMCIYGEDGPGTTAHRIMADSVWGNGSSCRTA